MAASWRRRCWQQVRAWARPCPGWPRGGLCHWPPEASCALSAGDAAVRRFRRLLVAELQRGFFDKHLWLSLWDRPPRSRFTRVQRATCCVLLVCLFLGANAVWYGVVGDAAYRWVPEGGPMISSCPTPPTPHSLSQPGSLSSPATQRGARVWSDPAECRHSCRRPGVQCGRLSRLPGHSVSLPDVPEQGGLGPGELPEDGAWASLLPPRVAGGRGRRSRRLTQGDREMQIVQITNEPTGPHF